ncbi:MAG: glucodextranase DOMON-like domain-containing protein [Halanaerobiales bacterium]
MKDNSLAFIIIIFFLFFSTTLIFAEEGILLDISDPTGDDYGPGTYQYPTNEIYSIEGLFDISNFVINQDEEYYIFEFTFTKLTDPWNSEFGFSLPLIHLYLANNEDSVSTELFQEGANVKLNPEYPWNRLIKISGWWVRVYSPDMKKEEHETNILDLTYPAEIEEPDINLKNSTIILKLEKELLGDLNEGYFYLFVGGFDPFGPDHFRPIQSDPSFWYFADPVNDELLYAPRILDLILPEGQEQVEVLSDFANGYPVISPIYIGFKEEKSDSIMYVVYTFLALFFLILAVIIKNNKFPLFNNK